MVAAFLSLCPFYLTENLRKQNLFLLVISEVVVCQSGTAQASKGFFHAGGTVRRIVPNKTNPQAERTGGKDRMLSLKTSPQTHICHRPCSLRFLKQQRPGNSVLSWKLWGPKYSNSSTQLEGSLIYLSTMTHSIIRNV